VALLAVFSLATLPACAKGCRDDHPYVPYSVGDGRDAGADAAVTDPALTAASGSASPGGSLAEPALLAPPRSSMWRVSGMDLLAPEGRELIAAIVRDFDGDGQPDALAIVRPPAATERRPNDVGAAQLVHYAGVAAGPPVVSVVTTAPEPKVLPGCVPVARLERIGARSAFAEVGTSCPRGGGSRAAFVVRLARQPAVSFDLAIVDPAGAPKLTLDAEAADRDKDGLDDVTLRVTIEGGSPPFEPGPKLTARLAFFDRPAGPSRDSEEPEASLRAIASQAASKAAKAKDAPVVPALVQQMRALFRAMCVEGGAPRLMELRRGATGAVTCGTSKPLEDAGVAEVRAFVAQADPIRAIAAAEIAQVSPATRTAARTTELKALLEQVAPVVQARSSRVLSLTVPVSRAAHPEWGSLGFDPSGKLLVRTASTVMRVDTDTGEAADAELPVWTTQVLSPDGKSRWLEAYHACEGVALRATFMPIGDGDMRDLLLPVAPLLGTRCAGGRGEAAPTVPIAWTARGLEALVAGQPLLIHPEASTAAIQASPTSEMPPFGSPRSAGGRGFALATAQGVLVRTTRAVRVRASDLEPFADLRQCTTVDDGSRVACVRRGKVVVASLDAL